MSYDTLNPGSLCCLELERLREREKDWRELRKLEERMWRARAQGVTGLLSSAADTARIVKLRRKLEV